MNIKRALLMSGACGILATAVSTALAQETSEVAEVVIVTGSYIRGTAEDAALPVDVISAEDLAKQGSPSTLEMIKGLSVSNGVLGDTNQFDARAQGTEGSGSVNLRGFGPQRTLVLLNGRRMVSESVPDRRRRHELHPARRDRPRRSAEGRRGGDLRLRRRRRRRELHHQGESARHRRRRATSSRSRTRTATTPPAAPSAGATIGRARCSPSATSTAPSCWSGTATGRPRSTWRIRRAAGRPPAIRTRSFRWAATGTPVGGR